MKLTIGFLYGDLMNIYGDTGNIITLKKRCEWRGIDVEVKNITIGSKDTKADIYFFGGGQDQQQSTVAKDLAQKGQSIKEAVEKGVPLLSICGGYQLLGEYYQPFDGAKLPGVGIFPAYTVASNDRMIGNIVVQTQSTNSQLPATKLVGFENHSGKTYLKEGGVPLGKVIKGFGNNGEDKSEGCVYKNAIGCYMHGSLLPKNPELADWLIQKALEIKYGEEVELKKLDDSLEQKVHGSIISRVV